jgi:aminoglycoside phosphotransferase (APT) family kinase protein
MAKPMPAAEVDVPAGLVRRLLAGQHPDLASLPVSFLANGWDNVLYRLGSRLLVRLPRRALGAEIIVNEQRWLPLLAPRLPLPVPAPERTGLPALGYPYSWSVVPFIPGIPAADVLAADVLAAGGLAGGGAAEVAVPTGGGAAGGGPDEVAVPAEVVVPDPLDWADVTMSLARFLGALHVPAPADAPRNPRRGGPLASRAGLFADNLQIGLAAYEDGEIGRAGWDGDAWAGAVGDRAGRVGRAPQASRDAVLGAWADALAAPVYAGPPLWLHGDLHPANILHTERRLSGVIDFGDITAGDPAADLSAAWMLLPLEWHEAFRAAYAAAGGPGDGAANDSALWRRARGWALALGLAFLAHSAGNPELLRVGRRTLAAVLTG